MEADTYDHEVLLIFSLSDHEWKSIRINAANFKIIASLYFHFVRTEFRRFRLLVTSTGNFIHRIQKLIFMKYRTVRYHKVF
jgi:hypothetical protein